MHSPTVFNFFEPDYTGARRHRGSRPEESRIRNHDRNHRRDNRKLSNTAIYSSLGPSSDRITLDLSNEQALAADPAQLVDHLNSLLMANNMSTAMRNILINAITQIPANNLAERAKTAIYLVINSPEFAIDK